MIVEHRTYILHPGKLGSFMQLMESEGIGIEAPVLGRLLGYYTSEIGELNKVVHLWAYESYEDRQARRAQLNARADWQAFVAKVVPMIRTMRNEVLVPAGFSPVK